MFSVYSSPNIPSSPHNLCSSFSRSECARRLFGSRVFLTNTSGLKVSVLLFPPSSLPLVSWYKNLRYLYLCALSHQSACILVLCSCCVVRLFVCGFQRFYFRHNSWQFSQDQGQGQGMEAKRVHFMK